MNYTTIQTTLDAVVAAISGIPAITTENNLTKVVAGKPFSRTTLIPARPNVLTVGTSGRDELIGIFQIDLFYPIASGSSAASAMADAVVAAFPRTYDVAAGSSRLRVTQSWREVGRVIEQMYVIPVTLAWSCIR